jgi:hypothetical protein
MLKRVKRLLRSPRVIVGEILGIALLCVLGASLPQSGSATPAELAGLRDAGPIFLAVTRIFALDHIFSSVWFLAVTGLAATSLVVVILEQLHRLRRTWGKKLDLADFRSAPFQARFERAPTSPLSAPQLNTWKERRVGLAGSPLFHLGLLLVILAGALRALFGSQAVVDLLEGETLPAGARGWSAQWPGLLASPVQFSQPVTLQQVEFAGFENGEMRQLTVGLLVGQTNFATTHQVAVNRNLRLSGGRLFLGREFGPAALLEYRSPGAPPVRQAALLRDRGRFAFEGVADGPSGLRIHLRSFTSQSGDRPPWVEVRIMRERGLVASTLMRPGDEVSLPAGQVLALRGIPFWARLMGDRDDWLWLAYGGFGLILAGAALIFLVIPAEVCVHTMPHPDREVVFVALRPVRLAPVFEERFNRLLQAQRAAPYEAPPRPDLAAPESAAGFTPGGYAPAQVAVAHAAPPGGLPVPVCQPSPALWLGLGLSLFLATGCDRVTTQEARRLVTRYNQVVAEAYRRGDVRLIDPVVGPAEGKKITGLIGVRQDLGLTLDSEMLSLEVTGVERNGSRLSVRTQERWRYCDRRIGSGQQVGEESTDLYQMEYSFTKTNNTWLVDQLRFTSPPKIGRKTPTWSSPETQGHEATAARVVPAPTSP